MTSKSTKCLYSVTMSVHIMVEADSAPDAVKIVSDQINGITKNDGFESVTHFSITNASAKHGEVDHHGNAWTPNG